MRRRAVVAEPDATERGRLAITLLEAFSNARAASAPVCLLSPRSMDDDPVFSLVPEDVPVMRARGLSGTTVKVRWRVRSAAQRAGARVTAARASFWLEWYRELRRHAGDERLPLDLRGELRRAAQRAFNRSASLDARRSGPQFPRAQIRDAVPVRLPEPLLERARAEARRLGIPETGLAAIDLRGHVHEIDSILAAIAGHRFVPVRLGSSPLVDLLVLFSSAFLLCDNADAQRFAYLTGTPTLTINATDAVSFYPVRGNGLYLLKDVIDLDSGRVVPLQERLTESYYRNLRNYGFRGNAGPAVRAAVDEMVTGVREAWTETTGQARFRALASDTGTLADRVRYIAKWGPVDGFIGEGRLARVQADA